MRTSERGGLTTLGRLAVTGLLLAGVCLPISAQISLGARHGFGMASSYLEKETWLPGAVNGLHVILPAGSITFQVEASMIPEVIAVDDGFDETSLSSVELPLMLRFPVRLPGPEWLQMALTVGPRIVFRFNGSDGSENLDWGDLHKLDVGLSVGAELGAVIGFYTVFLDVRAAGGMLPVARGYQARSSLAVVAIGYRVTFLPRPRDREETSQPAS